MKEIYLKTIYLSHRIFLSFIMTCCFGIALAQEPIKVSGTVTDSIDNQPIPGVLVQVESSKISTQTDVNGKYTIDVVPNSVVLFRYLGYQEKRVAITNETNVNVQLTMGTQSLDDVVVVAFGTQKKTSVTSAVSSLKGDEIASVPLTNLTNGIGGRMPGVIFQQSSGEPGNDASAIFIRGIATTGSSQPLLVVDGIPRPFQNLDPNSIETINILKDAAAVAPYGVAGANGVILVTTKRGKTGAPALSINSYAGFQNPTVLPEYINSFEYASLRNAASINEGNPPRYPDFALEKFRNGSDPDAYANSNALDQMVTKNTLLTSHNVELTGGSDKIKYYTGLGYQYQAGIWGPTNQNRYNLNLNLDAQATSTTKVALGITGRQQKNLYPSVGTSRIFELMKYALPVNPVRYQNGLNAHFPYGSVYGSGYSDSKILEVFSQLSVEQELPFIPGLSLKGQIAYDPSVSQYKSWVTPVHVWSIDTTKTPYAYLDGIFGQDKSSLSQSVGQSSQLTYQASINYQKNIGKSNLGVLALFESKSNDLLSFGGSRINYNLNIDELNMGSSSQADISNSGYSTQARQLGFVYRLVYDYASKYLAEASGRYDGSYYFAPGKQYGFFPSFSLGWRLSEENFIKQNLSWVDNLKIRGSYGEVGALAGGPFQYLSSYSVFGPAYAFGNSAVQGVRERSEANPDITWERAKKTNVGLEVSLWNSLFTLEADYFHEKRSNMLASPDVIVPVEYGIGLSQENAAVMENKGFEFSIGSNYSFNKDLQISLRGNFTYAKNTLLQVFETAATYNNPNRRVTGRSLGTQFGYNSLGFFKESDFETNGSLKSGIAIQPWGPVKPGDIRYEDISKDGKINQDDYTQIGNPRVPQIIYGFSPTVRFKNFALDLLFQGAGNSNFIGTGMYNWAFFNNTNVLKENLDYWTPANTDAKHPRITNAPTANNTQSSSFWMQDASYLRLKSGTIAYTFPLEIVQKLRLSNARLYVSGQNVLTWSKIDSYDPETVNANGNSYPQQKVFTFGLNVTF